MKKPLAVTMIVLLVLTCIPPAMYPTVQEASAYAPPPPPLPTPTSTPLPGQDAPIQDAHIPPSPNNLPPEVEQARARQAIEAVLTKYLRYWGPRYQVGPVEVTVEGEWAQGSAHWQSQARTLKEPIHILAHRLPEGIWQALIPSIDGLYLQWLDAVPESLVPSGKKSQLRTQAAEADALRQSQATPAVPPAVTVTLPSIEGPKAIVELIPGPTQPTATPVAQEPSGSNFNLLSDGQFVYGPNVADFDLTAYLRENSSALSRLAQDLDDKASYYSINPRVLLTILEIRSGAVTASSPLTQEQMDRLVGYGDIVGYDDQLFELGKTLVESYYQRLYSAPPDEKEAIVLTLNNGTMVHVPATTNAGTVAILTALAPFSSSAQWQTLISRGDPGGFFQTYRRLFPEDDPLDDSNQVIPLQAPPASLLKFPFACNDTWKFSGGPHDLDGDCSGGDPYSAVDFAPGVGYCVIPSDRWIVSPAAGTVSNVSCGGCQIKINHQDGWGSYFYHVANPQVSNGQGVSQDQHIGNPSTKPSCGGDCGGCKGYATGTHVHYGLMYNGAFVPIDGTAFEGWVVHGTTCYNGYLEKGGQQKWVGSGVTSECGGGTCSAPSLNSPNDGYTSSDRTITFNWSPPSDCTPDGYTFRVKTVSDMDSGGTTVFDEGQGGTQVTKQFGSEWDNIDLYWSVRACKPCTPYNPGPWASPRRFRIQPGGGEWPVRLYEHAGSSGRGLLFPQVDYGWWNLTDYDFSDIASSIEIDSGWSARLWLDTDLQPSNCHKCLTSSDSNFGGDYFDGGCAVSLNDQASSIEVFHNTSCSRPCNPNADQIALFVDANYSGQCVVKGIGQYSNPGAIGLPNDSISSIKVGGDVKAYLCRDDNFGGTCEWFTGDDPNLSDNSIGNDQVSSAKVEQRVQPPSAPTLSIPSNGSVFSEGATFTLYWNSVANATQYYAEYWGGPAGTLNSGWQSGISWYIGSQWAGYTYSWHVKARNSAGESGWSSTWTFTVKPAAPSNLDAQIASCNQINLYWTDNSDNEEGYKIYRNGSYVGQVGMNATSYQDTSVSENTTYSYYVKAFRGNIQSNASNKVNVTTPPCAPPQPDLRPYSPPGHPYPVVPSSIQGTHEVNTLYTGQPTYFDWHFINSGNATALGNFHVELWVDDSRYVRYPYSDYGAGWSGGFDDWSITISTPGWHTVRLITDPDDTIAESDETNNIWERQFYWELPPQPDLVPYQGSDWEFPVVPSSVQGTTHSNTLYAGRPTYFDWGVKNQGNAAPGSLFYVDLFIDDTRFIHYPFNFDPGSGSWFMDWSYAVNTPGWHTLKIVVDSENAISEADETNNVWERQFYWTPVFVAPYSDDMENGVNDWTATDLWHQVSDSSPYPNFHSPSHSWWYGQDSTGNYDAGAANSGDLTSPAVYIPSTGYYLRFWYRYETETQGPDWDQRWVQISVDGGPFNNVLQLSDDPMNYWLRSPAIALPGYAGHTIQVRFHFNTIDDAFNDYRGWYIDDFDISTAPPPNCADSHEPNNNSAQATTIAYGQTLNADICPGGDYDFYTFTGSAGDKVVVDIDAKVNGSSLDSYVFLLDSDGTSVLAEHDDEIVYEVQDSHLGYQLPHDGTYYIKVKAWNHPSVGGTDYFYTMHLFTDDTNPSSAEITSPSNEAWLNPNLETIAVSATDDESGINRIEFLWHDADWENSDWVGLGADQDARDGWSWDFDTSSLAEQRGGAFYIWAFDWVGNWTGAAVWNLGIDRTPPTATAGVSPMYGDAPFRDFYVWWYGSDNLSDIASYDVQCRDGPGGTWSDLVTGTTDTYYRFIGQDAHTYYFRARARDNAGNQSAYASGDGDAQHTVEICPTPPDDYEVDNTSSNAEWITTSGIYQTHTVHVEGDQDWVKFHAAADFNYVLATTNTGGHADTVLYLYDTDGSTLIDSNDDYPNIWPSSCLSWQPSASGVYYAKVDHWDPYAYGCTTAYDLSIWICDVDVADIMRIASRWRTSCDNPDPDNNPDTPNYETCYDINGDCKINVVDIMLVVKHWGEVCEPYVWIEGVVEFYEGIEMGCWVVHKDSMYYQPIGALADEIAQPENEGRRIRVFGQFRPDWISLCDAGPLIEVIEYEFLS